MNSLLRAAPLFAMMFLLLDSNVAVASGGTFAVNYTFNTTIQSKSCFITATGQPATLKHACIFNYGGKLSGYLILIYDDKEINGIHCWLFSTGSLQLNNVRESIILIGVAARACDNTPMPVTYGVAFDGGTNVFNFSSGSGTLTFDSNPFGQVGSTIPTHIKGTIILAS